MKGAIKSSGHSHMECGGKRSATPLWLVFVPYPSQDEPLKPKRRRASLAAALHKVAWLSARRHLRLHGLAAMLILFSIAAFSVKGNDQDPFIPPQATVILMSSLAGDVESENAYRDQLQTWLDILATSKPHRTI